MVKTQRFGNLSNYALLKNTKKSKYCHRPICPTAMRPTPHTSTTGCILPIISADLCKSDKKTPYTGWFLSLADRLSRCTISHTRIHKYRDFFNFLHCHFLHYIPLTHWYSGIFSPKKSQIHTKTTGNLIPQNMENAGFSFSSNNYIKTWPKAKVFGLET